MLQKLEKVKGLKQKLDQEVSVNKPTSQEVLRAAALRLAKLQIEALRLYEPLPEVEKFHASMAKERILRGSNRAGKTLGSCAELARCLTGQDPYNKYPKENGRCFVVGKDGSHNAEVLFRKLCRPNAFRVIRDYETGLWRSWRPWVQEDAERERETKAAPPLIPERFIKEISWASLKELQPEVMRLANGWEVRFFSSLGAPPQGSDLDVVLFDEEIVNPEWYSEVAVRGLVDRAGRFIWSATAQKGGPQLYDLCMHAAECRGDENPRVEEFFAHIDANKYFSDAQRADFFDKLTDEERRIRIEGEFAFTSYRVYPEFNINVHGIEPFDIPSDWTRYMVVDPGRQVCAVLFVAVPPPDHEHARHVFFYDELYIKSCNAEIFAEKVREKTMGHNFYAFLIDYRGGRVRSAESGIQIEQQYAAALKKHDVSSETTGNGFAWANDDVEAGIMKFRSWLISTKDGTPKLKVFANRLRNFEYEAVRYHYKHDKHTLTDKPVARNNHLMDCSRYVAMYDPQYYKPGRRSKTYDPWQIVKNKLKKSQQENPDYISLS